jgi:hypothetical protein
MLAKGMKEEAKIHARLQYAKSKISAQANQESPSANPNVYYKTSLLYLAKVTGIHMMREKKKKQVVTMRKTKTDKQGHSSNKT